MENLRGKKQQIYFCIGHFFQFWLLSPICLLLLGFQGSQVLLCHALSRVSTVITKKETGNPTLASSRIQLLGCRFFSQIFLYIFHFILFFLICFTSLYLIIWNKIVLLSLSQVTAYDGFLPYNFLLWAHLESKSFGFLCNLGCESNHSEWLCICFYRGPW